MPSELDPAFYQYGRRETPTEGMKRIELEMRDRPDLTPGRIATGAGRTREGYNASIGAQGPVGGGVMVAADPITGQPVMVGGRAQVGPLSYQYNKPTFKGAPASQQIGVGGQPFDSDAYFGVTAQQGPSGRSYGANVSQSGEDGGFNAYGQYNPSRRDLNVGGGYSANFANGGRASVGQTNAAGVPVTLETRKGDMRQRQDSGASRMAADYGYISNAKPDADGMKTDAFVGPHRDSKKVFVVNQQHPHTGKFNEHKVLLGYKDRAHALRDYAHSFSDGLGHKRIHSVVEMGTHELKDWLKKPHTEPLRKAEGGPVDEPRPLTIYRGERPTVEAEPETDLYPSQEERPIPMPVPRPDRRPVITPAMLAAQMVPPEQQSPIGGQQAGSPSPEGFTEGLTAAAEGVAPLGRIVGQYASSRAQDPTQIPGDLATFGKTMYHAATEDPIGFVGGMLPGIGNVMAAGDVAKLKDEAAKAEAEGKFELADKLKALVTTAMAGVAAPFGGGAVAKGALRSGERALLESAERGAAQLAPEIAERAAIESAEATGRMAEKFAGKAGTAPEEMARMFDDVRGTQVGKMVERYQDLPPEEAMQLLYQDLKGLAVEGEVGKEWYERSSKRILEFVGGDAEAADKFAQLIAIYSPQTAVDVNTQNAMKAYNRALTGEKLWDGQIVDRDRTFPTIKAANDYVKSLGGSDQGFTKIPLDDSGKRFLIAKHGNPNAYENIATLDRDLKAHLVMNEDVPFNGRKINNFYNNLMVQIDPSRLQGSTQDLWMARAFGYLEDAVGGGQKYEFMERLTADLAAELGWQPHQIQAAIWTAMKTRQEGVKDAVKAAAVDMGIAERVPDPTTPGKLVFQVKEGREAEYGALMREQSLGADITPEAIASAARDFSDFLDQNIAFITWEATPSTKVAHLDGFEKLPSEVKAEYQMGMQQALQDADGNDLLARYLNILSPGGLDAPGYWDGASNPQRLTQVGTTRIKAAGQAPTIDSASREMMEVYAAGMGLLLKQDGVGFHRPYYNPQISKANGIEYKFEKPLSSDDIVHLGKELEKKFGTDAVGLIPVGQDTVRVINFYWPAKEHGFAKVHEYRTAAGKKAYAKSAKAIPEDAGVYPEFTRTGEAHPQAGKRVEFKHKLGRITEDELGKQSLQTFRDQRDFHRLVDEIVQSDKIDNTFDARFFGSDGDLISNTTPNQAAQKDYPGWKGNPNGEGYIQRLRAAGRSDVLEYLSDVLAPRVEAFDRAFAAKHGLKRNEALEGQIRNAKDLSVDYAKGGPVKGFAQGGPVAPASAPQSFGLDQKVEETVQDVVGLATDGDIDQRKLAFLLRKASTGTMPADVSYTFAGEIMSNDTQALIERFNRYPRSIRVLARVDLALGGMGGQSLGTLANQKMRADPASPTGSKDAGYAKGGKVVRKPHTGGKEAFEQFSDFAMQNYGGQVGRNMIKRAGGDAAKLMFALNQYTKNLVAQDPQHAQQHQQQLQQLNQMAQSNQISPQAAFNRTPDAMDTRKELQDILKGDHNLNPAFKMALQRMDRLVGSQ